MYHSSLQVRHINVQSAVIIKSLDHQFLRKTVRHTTQCPASLTHVSRQSLVVVLPLAVCEVHVVVDRDVGEREGLGEDGLRDATEAALVVQLQSADVCLMGA